MNRQRAYRKLMSLSATSRSKHVIDIYDNLAFYNMATTRPRSIPILNMADRTRSIPTGPQSIPDRPRSIPIVKLKIGEALTNQKKGQSVAELNNLRSNYNNYCHYRMNGRREFPPLQGTSPAPSPVPPSRDGTVIFMLRGTQRRSRSMRRGSPASTQLRGLPAGSPQPGQQHYQQTPTPTTPTPASPSYSGHLIVKRKDSNAAAGTTGAATTNEKTSSTAPPNVVNIAAAAASQQSVDVTTPTAPNSTCDPCLNGYEIRGSSVFKSSNPELRDVVDDDDDDDDVMAYTNNRMTTVTRVSPSFVFRQTTNGQTATTRRNQRILPRPGSYITSRRSRDQFRYENEQPGVRYDYRSVHSAVGAPQRGKPEQRSSTSGRRVRFDEERIPASVSTYIFPIDERGLRLTSSQQPLQLTQKNLEIFDYLHNPRNNLGSLIVTTPGDTQSEQAPNSRVLHWVQERQLDMSVLLRGATSEGDIVGMGLPPTPEVNELNGDLDDPDLEVYDLTKEEDFLPHDVEVIDAVIDDGSCD